MRTLVRYFLQGCLVLVPSVLTAYVLYLVVRQLDRLLGSPLPGLGIAIALVAITAVGALASNVLGRAVLKRVERLIGRVPLVRLVYTTVRDLVGAFFGEERSFDRPALVRFSDDGSVKGLGFITRDDLAEFGIGDHVLVYFPQAYNWAGSVLALPRSMVEPLAVDGSRFMALVLSGGVVTGAPAGASVRPPPAQR